jgi:hypothetical protein
MMFLNQKYILNAKNVISSFFHDEFDLIQGEKNPVDWQQENHKTELCRNGVTAYP